MSLTGDQLNVVLHCKQGVYVCRDMFTYIDMFNLCIYASILLCMCVCIIYMYVCMYMYECIYICMCVYLFVFLYSKVLT